MKKRWLAATAAALVLCTPVGIVASAVLVTKKVVKDKKDKEE